MEISICPNCKCVTCPGCEDEDKPFKPKEVQTRQTNIDREIAQRHIAQIRQILGGEKNESSDKWNRSRGHTR